MWQDLLLLKGIVFCFTAFLLACSGNPRRELTAEKPLPDIRLIFCLGNVREQVTHMFGKSFFSRLNGYTVKITSFLYREKPIFGKEPVFFEATGYWTAPTIEVTVPQTGFGYRIYLELGELESDRTSKQVNCTMKQVYCTSLESGHKIWLKLHKEDLRRQGAEHKAAVAFPLFVTPAGKEVGLERLSRQLAHRKAVELYTEPKSTGFSEIDIGNPASPDFFTLEDGTDLKQFDRSFETDECVIREKKYNYLYRPLAPLLDTKTGFGQAFTTKHEQQYRSLKGHPRFHWAVRELDTNRLLGQSENAGQNVTGASISKIVVIAAAVNNQGGRLASEEQWRDIIVLGIKSWCSPWWDRVEELAGGTEGVNRFTGSLGLTTLQASRYGGNMVNALELSEFYYHVLHNGFAGADVIYKLASACETGPGKGRKYMPSYLYLGGKTGFWQGFNHDSRFFRFHNRWYVIVVLTTHYTPSEELAVVFGGIFREYVAKTSLGSDTK